MVKDINSGSGWSSPGDFTVLGNTLYFTANDGINGRELWKSDGTSTGTVMVKDIRSGVGSNPGLITTDGNTLYFTANDGSSGIQLWKSDGTSTGTVKVSSGFSGSNGFGATLVVVGDNVFFVGYHSFNYGYELYAYRGTSTEVTYS